MIVAPRRCTIHAGIPPGTSSSEDVITQSKLGAITFGGHRKSTIRILFRTSGLYALFRKLYYKSGRSTSVYHVGTVKNGIVQFSSIPSSPSPWQTHRTVRLVSFLKGGPGAPRVTSFKTKKIIVKSKSRLNKNYRTARIDRRTPKYVNRRFIKTSNEKRLFDSKPRRRVKIQKKLSDGFRETYNYYRFFLFFVFSHYF